MRATRRTAPRPPHPRRPAQLASLGLSLTPDPGAIPDAQPRARQSVAARRLTVLLVSETYLPDVNGAAYFIDRLAHGIAGRGHEVHIACPAPAGPEPPSLGRVTVHRMPSWPIPGYPQARVGSPARARRYLHRLTRDLHPDVLHVQNHFVLGRAAVAIAKREDIPVIATNHFLPDNFTAFASWLPTVVKRGVEALLWRGVRRVYRDAVIVTAPTSYAAGLTERRARIPEVIPVSCGVDRSAFAPTGAAKAFRARYGLPDRPTLLHVGRLDPDKHVDCLIRALGLVRRWHDAQLVVIGRGPLIERLRTQARRLGLAEHVHFCGFVEDADLPGAYEAADIYCNAGVAELQSITTLEAMAAHRPVLAADAHALPLLVRDGANGRLFPPGDVAVLARCATGLLDDSDRRRAMGIESARRVAVHDLGSTVDTFEAAYHDVSVVPAPEPVPPRALSSRGLRLMATGVACTLAVMPMLHWEAVSDTDVRRPVYVAALLCAMSAWSLATWPPLARAMPFLAPLPQVAEVAIVRVGRALLSAAVLAVIVLLALIALG